MAIKRLITDEQKTKIKDQKKHKGKTFDQLSTPEKWELVEIIAKKLNLL